MYILPTPSANPEILLTIPTEYNSDASHTLYSSDRGVGSRILIQDSKPICCKD